MPHFGQYMYTEKLLSSCKNSEKKDRNSIMVPSVSIAMTYGTMNISYFLNASSSLNSATVILKSLITLNTDIYTQVRH